MAIAAVRPTETCGVSNDGVDDEVDERQGMIDGGNLEEETDNQDNLKLSKSPFR